MLNKLILILSLLPLLAGLAARHFFYERIVRHFGKGEVSLEAREVARRILKKGGAEDAEILEKRSPFLPVGPKHLVLTKKIASSRRAQDVAEAAHLAGLVLMARRESRVVAWRVSAVKFGWSFPAFSILVLVFAMIVRTVPIWWGISLIALSCAFASISLWSTLNIERNAAQMTARLLADTPILPRREEGELLARLTRAQAWKRIIPGILQWLGKE